MAKVKRKLAWVAPGVLVVIAVAGLFGAMTMAQHLRDMKQEVQDLEYELRGWPKDLSALGDRIDKDIESILGWDCLTITRYTSGEQWVERWPYPDAGRCLRHGEPTKEKAEADIKWLQDAYPSEDPYQQAWDVIKTLPHCALNWNEKTNAPYNDKWCNEARADEVTLRRMR